MRRKGGIAVLLALVAVFVGVNLRQQSSPEERSLGSAAVDPRPATARNPALATPEALLQITPPKSDAGSPAARRRNIFEYGAAPAPEQARERPEQANVSAESSRPSGPSAPVRFYGFSESSRGGYRRVFLTDGEEIYVAAEGDVVLKRYRIARVGKESIELEEVAGQNRWVLPLEQP